MTQGQSKSGTTQSGTSAVVILVVLLLLGVPCMAGLLLVGGLAVFRLQAPQPIALPLVPGANAPLPLPGNMAIPANAPITVNRLNSSQNLFDAAEEILTLAKYEQIKPSMTYEGVLSVLAIPENKRPDDMELVGPESDVELKWFGGTDDALSITLKLKGKVVVDKAQTGLK